MKMKIFVQERWTKEVIEHVFSKLCETLLAVFFKTLTAGSRSKARARAILCR